jgi:hypothetical protein
MAPCAAGEPAAAEASGNQWRYAEPRVRGHHRPAIDGSSLDGGAGGRNSNQRGAAAGNSPRESGPKTRVWGR